MKIYTAIRGTGDFIDEVSTIEEGWKLIREYEDADIAARVYDQDNYNVVDENHHNVNYTVFWVGGKRDGETLALFGDYADATEFARQFFDDHESEFALCGGVAIVDEYGRSVS